MLAKHKVGSSTLLTRSIHFLSNPLAFTQKPSEVVANVTSYIVYQQSVPSYPRDRRLRRRSAMAA